MSVLQKRSLASYEGQYIMETDREYFELFYTLVPHLKELESCIETRDTAQAQQEQAKSKLELPIFTVIISAVLYTLAFAVPFLIVFYIVINVVKLDNGESLFSVYDKWVGNEPITNTVANWIMPLAETESLFWQFMIGLLCIAFMLIVPPCIYFLLPLALVFCVISGIFTRITAKKDLKESIIICESMEQKIDQLVDELIIPLQVVPQDYRYSDALEYFCNSYFNGRARTLQEAIAAYDTYLHRKKMEHAQEVIHNDQTMILEEIRDQKDKIDRLQDTIKRVKDNVDWL